MRFSKDQLEDLRIAAGSGAKLRPSEDTGHVETRVSTPEGVARVLRLAGHEGIPVFTRLFPFGSVEYALSGELSIILDTTAITGVVEYSPADMVLTARAGTPVAAIQEAAAAHGQWLPIDPPAASALTLGELVAKNEWGPLRTLHGTIRDHLLGCQVILPSGKSWKSGGRVVKSATGYDFHRTQIGALESLAIGVSFTVRLAARPEAVATMAVKGTSREDLVGRALRVRELLDAPAALFVLDGPAGGPRLCIRYEGSRPAVELAMSRVNAITGAEQVDPAAGEALLREAREGPLDPGFRSWGRPGIAMRLTFRPSRAVACVKAAMLALERHDEKAYICAHPSIAAADAWIVNSKDADPKQVFREVAAEVVKAGGGTARLRRPYENYGGVLEGVKSLDYRIMERLKVHFDPRNILNPGILPFPVKPGEFAPPARAASVESVETSKPS